MCGSSLALLSFDCFVDFLVICAQVKKNTAILSFNIESIKMNLSVQLLKGKIYVNSVICCFLVYSLCLSISVICQAIFCSVNAWTAATMGLLEFFQLLKISWFWSCSINAEDIWGNNRWLSAYIASCFHVTSLSQPSAGGGKKNLCRMVESIQSTETEGSTTTREIQLPETKFWTYIVKCSRRHFS